MKKEQEEVMAKMVLDMEKYAECARAAAAEGQVLLCNENNVLPIPEGWQYLAEFRPTITRAEPARAEW